MCVCVQAAKWSICRRQIINVNNQGNWVWCHGQWKLLQTLRAGLREKIAFLIQLGCGKCNPLSAREQESGDEQTDSINMCMHARIRVLLIDTLIILI